MAERTIKKYQFYGKLFWMLFRPIAVAAAKSSKTDVDDGLVEAMDLAMTMDFSDLDGEET